MIFLGSRNRLMTLMMAMGCLIVGCGGSDNLPRQPIDGTVTIDGRLLTGAVIRFVPVDPKAGPTAETEVKDGTFVVGREQGPVPGSYRVVITSKTPDDPLPLEYNERTMLSATVTPGGNTFHFPLARKIARR